jgi:hypothetical protein
MLTPEQIAAIRDQAGQITTPITNFLLEDIARRVSEAGQLTSTAAYQVWRAQQLGMSRKEIKKELRKRLKVSQKEIEQLLTQSAEVGYNFDLKRLPHAQAVPFEQSESLQQIVRAAVELAQEDFTNLTQTLGMVDPFGNVLPLQDVYRSCTDFAFKQVITGATDYNTAIRRATKNLAEKGVLTIDYESGVHTSLEAAVRRNIMGGLGLMQEQITQHNHDELGCDGWEISAHANSAPDHEPIQGKQYSDAAYEALNNSLVRRIGTLNCGHAAFPIILGVNEPQYSPEELEKFREDNQEGVTVDGKHYTGYEATQMQRKLERSMRLQKRRILTAEATGDKDALAVAQTRLQRLRQEYSRFSKAAGLRTENERAQVAGFGRKQAASARAAAKAASMSVASVKTKPSPTTSTEPPKSYTDITGKWYPDAKPNSHTVEDLQSVTIGGVTYAVDGRNVQLKYSEHEKEIAELLEREVGGEIFMVPRVNNPQGVRTSDYKFHGKWYDLKTLKSDAGKNTMFNRVKNAKGQATGFLIDVTKTNLDDQTIDNQIDKIFWSRETQFVDEIVIIRGDKIVRVVKRI